MEIFEIHRHNGESCGYVQADNERQALCKYLMEHEELDDMMLWKSAFYMNEWKLAPYNKEDEYLWARKHFVEREE